MTSFQDHYSDRAAEYAAYRPNYPEALGDFLGEAAPRRRLAWDAGCGSGQVSVLLADRFERVAATDASRKQLIYAARRPNLAYWCASAESSGLPPGRVDLAVSAQAAHWFDAAAYYAEIRRVTHAGSIAALVTYGIMTINADIDPLLHDFYKQVIGPFWPPQRRHVEKGYRSLPFPFDEIEAPQLEMSMRWTFEDFFGYLRTWSAVRAMEKSKGPAPRQAFRRKLARAWGPQTTVRSVRWPLSLRVGRL